MEKINKSKTNKLISKEEEIKIKILQSTEQIAKQLLKDIGMKIHCIGFNYWILALYTAIDNHIYKNIDKKEKEKITQIYYLIARYYKTNVSNVRKAMSYAYDNLDLNRYFNVTYKINNAALLFLLKDKVLEKLKATL